MYGFLVTIHIIVCVFLVLIILMQAGRSGGLSGLMGGGGADALFSASGQQSGLRKATGVIALLFLCTSLGLTILSSRQREKTVFDRGIPVLPQQPVPPAPAEAPQSAPNP